MTTTFYAIDPRDSDPQGTVEFTVEGYIEAGGDLDDLRSDALINGDYDLIALVDGHRTGKVLVRTTRDAVHGDEQVTRHRPVEIGACVTDRDTNQAGTVQADGTIVWDEHDSDGQPWDDDRR